MLFWSVPSVGADSETIVLFAAGDIMLARRMHRVLPESGAEDLFGGVLPHMRSADLAFANLECVLSDRGHMTHKGERAPFHYRARPEMTRFLEEAGVDAVSQANNHAGDFGPSALADSLDILGARGIAAMGAGHTPEEARSVRYTRAGDSIIAWVAFDSTEPDFAAVPGKAGTFYVPENRIAETVTPLIREARGKAGLVIATCHWGENWKDAPTPARREAARALIDAGADAVLGHSSHFINGMEIYKGRPILYDMGPLLFDSVTHERMRDSMFFLLKAQGGAFRELAAFPVRLRDRSTDLAKGVDVKRIADLFAGLSKELDPGFQAEFDGQALRVPLAAEPHAPEAAAPVTPATGSFDFSRKPACVLKELPVPAAAEPVKFSNGVRLLAAALPASAGQASFTLSLYFDRETGPALPPFEIGVALGRQNAAHHEPGNWSYPSPLWEPGEIVEDSVLYRMGETEPGEYDIFISLVDRSGAAVPPGRVSIGKLNILPKRPYRAPGLLDYEDA